MAAAVEQGSDHDDHFFGMFRLREHGIDATFLEIESIVPVRFATFLRRHVLSMHFVHVPLLWTLRRYDVVLASAALGALLVRTLTGIGPRQWIMYDYNVSGMVAHAHTWKERLYAWLMGRVDGFITLSREEAKVLKDMYPEKADKIAFIPFGCDTKYWQSHPALAVEEDLIVSVGRDPGRDWKTLLAAVSDLPAKVQLTLPPERLAREGTVPANVTTSALDPAELTILFARAGVVVLPLAPRYPHDTMGLSTLVEAMAMGKAVVATDTETMRTYLTHGEHGILVPQGDAKAMHTAIMDLLHDKAKRRRLGQAARVRVCELCDADMVAEQLATYLQGV